MAIQRSSKLLSQAWGGRLVWKGTRCLLLTSSLCSSTSLVSAAAMPSVKTFLPRGGAVGGWQDQEVQFGGRKVGHWGHVPGRASWDSILSLLLQSLSTTCIDPPPPLPSGDCAVTDPTSGAKPPGIEALNYGPFGP